MHEFPDTELFTAIQTLQKSHGLPTDGRLAPQSETHDLINQLLTEQGDTGSYIWRTVDDDSVRPAHAARSGQTFNWSDHPDPGEEPGCRCWAENVIKHRNSPPIINDTEERIKAILENKPAIFEIAKNPQASGNPPLYTSPTLGWIAVKTHESTIEKIAKDVGIDPDLIKAIMWAENARGAYLGAGYIADALGESKTILPMNINPKIWYPLVSKDPNDLYNSSINILTAALLIQRIEKRINNPSAEKIGAIWQFIGQEKTNDYAAYIQKIYDEKPWK
jgi:hypothetical protein